jgi:pimeloyl-ACP methyl ester carboxylesterase
MLENPVSDRLSLIKQPTLVFFGLNDKFIPNRIFHKTTTEEIARTGTDKIPNSKLIMIPECGHFIPFEKPDEFNNAVINFLTS